MGKQTGRPKASEPKSTFIGMKLTAAEALLIRQAAERDARSTSNWARLILVAEAKRQLGIDPGSGE